MSQPDHHISLVLGGGGARGFAHIGVIKCLEEHSVPVDSIVGTSIGAIVGGAYACGLSGAEMERIAQSLDSFTMLKTLLPGLSSTGLVHHDNISKFLVDIVGRRRIEDLPVKFRAVATDLLTGEEFVFDKGPLVDAIIASIALPVIFQPAYIDGRYLVDGGLSNPVPISVARALHPDFCIAVNVTPGPERMRGWIQRKAAMMEQRKNGLLHTWFRTKLTTAETVAMDRIFLPTALRVTMQSVSITSYNLLTHHLKHAQPDLMLTPQIEEYELLEFNKGAEIVGQGYESAKLAIEVIERML